jgi:molybdopterin synthase sulfur carrier subunit
MDLSPRGCVTPQVRLDGMLREFVPRLSLDSPAASIGGLLDDLEGNFPRLRRRLRDESGAMRPFVRIFVNGEDMRGLDGLKTRLTPKDQVDILHSIQGG